MGLPISKGWFSGGQKIKNITNEGLYLNTLANVTFSPFLCAVRSGVTRDILGRKIAHVSKALKTYI